MATVYERLKKIIVKQLRVEEKEITFRLPSTGTTVPHKNVRISCCFKAGGGLTVHEDGGMSF